MEQVFLDQQQIILHPLITSLSMEQKPCMDVSIASVNQYIVLSMNVQKKKFPKKEENKSCVHVHFQINIQCNSI
jgi:hypothetical protein